jgi:hypothetical protein
MVFFRLIPLVMVAYAIIGTNVYAEPAYCLSEEGALQTDGQSAGVAIYGELAYIADLSSFKVLIVDVGVPEQPVEIGSIAFSDWVIDVIIDGDLLYVCDRFDGLFIYSLQDPLNPMLVGSYDDPLLGITDTLVIEEGIAYIADQANGLVVLDVSDPGSPVLLSRLNMVQNPAGIAYWDGFVYLAMSSIAHGVDIVDVRDPAKPVFVGELITPSFAMDLVIRDGIAYIADNLGGMLIADVMDPLAPVLLGSFDTPGRVFDVALAGSALLAADQDSGLWVFTITNPLEPRLLNWIDTPGQARAIASDGSLCVLGDGTEGIRTFMLDAGCVSDCVADVNGDGHVDYFDISIWIQFYFAGAPGGDLNGDGTVDKNDALLIFAALNHSCPSF